MARYGFGYGGLAILGSRRGRDAVINPQCAQCKSVVLFHGSFWKKARSRTFFVCFSLVFSCALHCKSVKIWWLDEFLSTSICIHHHFLSLVFSPFFLYPSPPSLYSNNSLLFPSRLGRSYVTCHTYIKVILQYINKKTLKKTAQYNTCRRSETRHLAGIRLPQNPFKRVYCPLSRLTAYCLCCTFLPLSISLVWLRITFYFIL